jgi:hypothetical protein
LQINAIERNSVNLKLQEPSIRKIRGDYKPFFSNDLSRHSIFAGVERYQAENKSALNKGFRASKTDYATSSNNIVIVSDEDCALAANAPLSKKPEIMFSSIGSEEPIQRYNAAVPKPPSTVPGWGQENAPLRRL